VAVGKKFMELARVEACADSPGEANVAVTKTRSMLRMRDRNAYADPPTIATFRSV